jgi:citrate synthase
VSDRAQLKIGDKTIDLPVILGSEGEVGIDVGKLRATTGAVTLDPAYLNTACVSSAITFLDGERGILRYRGIPIEQLAEHATFVEVAFLLI